MVSLQVLHLGDTLRHPNISTGMGLMSSYPWCFNLDRNAETIVIHLREVHYRMVIMCNICWAFASMTAQSILDHHLGCKAKHNKEHMECEGHEKAQRSHKKKKSKSQGQKGMSESLGSDAAKKSC